jgi:hypothetical protein
VGIVAVTALLGAALAGVDGTSFEPNASVRAQTSAHTYSTDGFAPRGLVAEDVLPRLSVLLDHRDLRLSLRYEPQLRLTKDPASPDEQAAFVQGGSLHAEWDAGPAWRATGDARAAERLVDLGAPGAGPRLLDLRVGTANVRYLDAGAAAAVEGRIGPALTLRTQASADDTGGVEPEDRVVLPRMLELRAGAGLSRQQSRIDVLQLDLSALAASVDGGGEASILGVAAGWRRELTRTVRMRIAASVNDARGQGQAARVLPGGDLELESTGLAGRALRLSAALRAGPAVDRYGARVEERIGAESALGWAFAPRWSLEAGGAAGRILEEQGYTAARGELRAIWRVSRRTTLSGGAWSEWHLDPRLAVGGTSLVRGAMASVELSTLAR